MGAPTLYAQVDREEKRPLDHEDYAKWNSLGGQNFSPDGSWVSYTLSPAEGDATLKIRQVDSVKEFSVLRGQRARFTDDNQHVLYVVAPSEEEVVRLCQLC